MAERIHIIIMDCVVHGVWLRPATDALGRRSSITCVSTKQVADQPEPEQYTTLEDAHDAYTTAGRDRCVWLPGYGISRSAQQNFIPERAIRYDRQYRRRDRGVPHVAAKERGGGDHPVCVNY